MKLSRGGKDYYERITVDTRKRTEVSRVTEASSGKDAGDAIYDFKRVSSSLKISLYFTFPQLSQIVMRKVILVF